MWQNAPQPYLKKIILNRAEELLAGLNSETTIEQQIEDEIVARLPSGSVSIDKIAVELGYSQ